MSLIKCKECGHDVSKKADKCPSCGNPIKGSGSSLGCGTLLIVGFVIVLLYSAFDTDSGSKSSAPKAPLTPEQQRTADISKQFSAWDGSHRKLEEWVISNLKDPDSYEHIESRYTDKGADGIYVVLKYRAKNSFGGYVVGAAAATYDINGNVIVYPVSLE